MLLKLPSLRYEKDLTIEKVAAGLTTMCQQDDKYGLERISTSQYGSWDRGKRNPSLKQLQLLADYYQVSTDYLLGRTKARSAEEPSVLEDIGIEQDSWWEIKREATSDARACAKVFAWMASGKSIKEILDMSNKDKDLLESKWLKDKKADKNILEAMFMRCLNDGVVEINADKIPLDEQLAEALRTEFPFLQEIRVVKVSENASPLLTKTLVGEVAAKFFDEFVRPGSNVGLSGGTTLATMTTALKKYDCEGITLFPFDNGPLPEIVDIVANTLIGRISYSHPQSNIRAYALQYIGFDDSPRPVGPVPKQPRILSVLNGAKNVDVGFVGIGEMTPEFLEGNTGWLDTLSSVKIKPEEIISDKATATILYHCICIDGKYFVEKIAEDDGHKEWKAVGKHAGKFNKRVCSVSPLRLRELVVREQRRIVGVASGAKKGIAVCSVLNGEYVNNLIIDSKLAEATHDELSKDM